MSFKNLRLFQKMLLLIGLFTIALSMVVATGYYFMRDMNSSAHHMYNDRLLPVKYLNDMRRLSRVQEMQLYEAMLVQTKDQERKLIEESNRVIAEASSLFIEYEKTEFGEVEKNKFLHTKKH